MQTHHGRTKIVAAGALLVAAGQLAVALSCARPAEAGPNAGAKIVIHVGPKQGTVLDHPCAHPEAFPACADVNTSGALYPGTAYPYVYLLVMEGDSTAGVYYVECGLEYDATPGSGVDIFSWSRCATSELPVTGPNGAWPSSGSGNRIYWDQFSTCQRTVPHAGEGVVAVAGYFYLGAYGPDTLAVVPNAGSGKAIVADCSQVVDVLVGPGVDPDPSPLGSAVFSEGAVARGYNPCRLPTPARKSTWGGIKQLYKPS